MCELATLTPLGETRLRSTCHSTAVPWRRPAEGIVLVAREILHDFTYMGYLRTRVYRRQDDGFQGLGGGRGWCSVGAELQRGNTRTFHRWMVVMGADSGNLPDTDTAKLDT